MWMTNDVQITPAYRDGLRTSADTALNRTEWNNMFLEYVVLLELTNALQFRI